MITVKQMFRCEIEQQRSLFKIPCFADISFHPDFSLHGLFTCVFCGKCKYVYNKTPQGIFKVKENVAAVIHDEFQKLVNKAKIPSAHNFLCPASDFEEQTFHSHS